MSILFIIVVLLVVVVLHLSKSHRDQVIYLISGPVSVDQQYDGVTVSISEMITIFHDRTEVYKFENSEVYVDVHVDTDRRQVVFFEVCTGEAMWTVDGDLSSYRYGTDLENSVPIEHFVINKAMLCVE